MITSIKQLKGNRGEWGEAYAFCHVLGTGRIASTDDNLKVNERQIVSVESVKRREASDRNFEYLINTDEETVDIIKNGVKLRTVAQVEFENCAQVIFDGIKSLRGRSFAIPEADGFLQTIGCHKLKPSDTDKPDLVVHIFDPKTSSEYDMKYSVKCMAGSRPSLVNPSGLTYFYYELVDFDASGFHAVSTIPQNQVKNRVAACRDHSSSIRYRSLSPDAGTFKRNLARVHPYAESTLGYMILESYFVKGKHSRQILGRVKRSNPLDEEDASLYDIAFRQYLWAAFCGMVPSVDWAHKDTVDGFLLINEVGDTLSYPIVKRGAFEEHLIDTTCFDTPSTSSDRPTAKTGEIYECNSRYYLTLNLQIKYDANGAKAEHRPKVRCVKTANTSTSTGASAKCSTITFGYH
ncbi:HpaII family restriction endonuclease [uncultured Slackia sp.]|uniref:HpaII family restriction endonuclease n=1 Tax=uncultured Slackia sp. TaxID=665903 RepID=UPI0026DECCA3|nr:HpaII family restriction endonuclease [uncultured Slackia sp.]